MLTRLEPCKGSDHGALGKASESNLSQGFGREITVSRYVDISPGQGWSHPRPIISEIGSFISSKFYPGDMRPDERTYEGLRLPRPGNKMDSQGLSTPMAYDKADDSPCLRQL